jgi:hypothetical protein
MGNHELGLTRPEYLSWFNASARESLILTGSLLSRESKEWLGGLYARPLERLHDQRIAQFRYYSSESLSG